jgi:hypothetical protein
MKTFFFSLKPISFISLFFVSEIRLLLAAAQAKKELATAFFDAEQLKNTERKQGVYSQIYLRTSYDHS